MSWFRDFEFSHFSFGSRIKTARIWRRENGGYSFEATVRGPGGEERRIDARVLDRHEISRVRRMFRWLRGDLILHFPIMVMYVECSTARWDRVELRTCPNRGAFGFYLHHEQTDAIAATLEELLHEPEAARDSPPATSAEK